MTYRYIPPNFELYEFDDGTLSPDQRGSRNFSDWNGPASKPAEEVSLAWSLGEAAVLVSSSGRADAMEWARLSAAHLAVGGTTLPIPARPDTTRGVQEEIQRIAQSTGLWSPGPAIIPHRTPADLAVCDGFSLAYSQAGSVLVIIAAVGVGTDQLKVRKVRDWDAYDFDATQSHSPTDLAR
jgi:hypothetical protein